MVSGARAHLRRACRMARPTTSGLVVAGLLLASFAIVIPASGAAAGTPSSAAATVRVEAVTPYVEAPGGVVSLTLARTGPLVGHDATIQLTLFSRLTTRFGLESAIGPAGPVGAVAQTLPLPARCLPGSGAVSVLAGVAPTGTSLSTPMQCGHRAPVLHLGCATACDGVYPMRVTVRGAGSEASAVTLVTFASPSRAPLRVVWVLRVAGPTSGLTSATGVLQAAAAHPRVPLTVDTQGWAIANGLTLPGGRTAVVALRDALAGNVHELIGESYAPVDLGALRASGLASEVAAQFGLDGVVLSGAGIHQAPSAAVTYGTGPQTPTSLDAIASDHFHHLLVDGTALAQDPTNSLTWGAAFRIAGAPSGPSVLAGDTALSALSEQAASDPSLVAAQFLGELSFLHFEQPNLVEPRAAVVITDATAGVPRSFVDTVLRGLAKNPVLDPVTASDAFSTVAIGANGFPSAEPLAPGSSSPLPPATISMVRFLRLTLDALRSAVTGGATPIPAIDGQLLAAESVLTPSRLKTALEAVHHALEAQVGLFRIYKGPITLTSSGVVSIPITVFSNAPYSVRGILQLASPRITFPHAAIAFTLTGSVRSIRIRARALVNGDLPLKVQLVSPDHNIVLARAEITVRVTGFSAVGIALTVLAVLVLAVWWVRTARRRRTAK